MSIDSERPQQPQPSVDGTQLITIDAAALASLLHLNESTVRSDISRRPTRLPNGIRVGKRTLWMLDTVLAWLKAQERPLTEVRRQRVRKVSGPRGKLGRPTKVEQVEARRLGVSVPELRRRNEKTAGILERSSEARGGQ